MGNGAEPQDLDPQITTGVPEHRLSTVLFEGLVTLDFASPDLPPIPAVAERWTVSDDGLVYTFTLRENARWSNGDPVTARDFVYSWQRVLSPKLASEYSYMLFCLKNAKAFNEGKIADFAKVGVKALDDRTLEASLEAPTPYFLSMQVHNSWFPVHQATIERFGKMDERSTPWTRPGNHVGNGPFLLERWSPNEVIRVVKNPHYWDAAKVRLDAIEFYPIDNQLTEERSFRAGELHLTESVPLSKIEVYQRVNPDLIHIDPYLGSYYYRFNVTKPPFDNVLVRRAFAMAIDRETLVAKVLKGGQKPASCFTPPGVAGYTCAASIPYDPGEAKKLLAQAGYPDGKGLPPIEFLYNSSENHKLIAEAIQNMWKLNLGVEVGLANQDWKVYLDSMKALNYQIARSGWIADYV
ncbi:MAG: oligopeptide transport system substrate-binding protein, partial [Candidatus Hydrogenedentes bacterium]|nr:oligopeptide transport system substrate-binding protein [Candidatus Hydrogenedentota bacterium]